MKGMKVRKSTVAMVLVTTGCCWVLAKWRSSSMGGRKHPAYHYSHKVQMNEFHSKTKFRLIIQNTIVVK